MPNQFAYRQMARVPAAGIGEIEVEVVRAVGQSPLRPPGVV